MRAVLLLLAALVLLQASVGQFVRDTGSKQLGEILKGLHNEAGDVAVFASNVKTYFFKNATKDNFAIGSGAHQLWDTFDDNGNFGQMYKVVDEYLDLSKGGPIFLFIGAEAPFDDGFISDTSFINYAGQKHGALVVGLEHRYYGATRPTDNIVPGLFSSEQALADVNRFLPYLKKKYGLDPETPVIVFGYSYGGSLASWFKTRYPHAAVGAISSSGPLFAEVDFYQYLEVVGEALISLGTQKCYDVLQEGVTAFYDKLLAQQYNDINDDLGGAGISSLESGIEFAGSYLVFPITDIVQYNGFKPATVPTVPQLCTWLIQNGDAYGAYNTVIAYMKSQQGASPNRIIDERKAWAWQYCNEFGWFQTASSPNQPFYKLKTGWDEMALYDLTCKAYFGADVQFPPNVVDTNFEYGGLDVSADNVTYVHGSLDPWHSIGVADGTDLHSSSVYYIENGSHCNDAFNPDLVFLSDSVKKVQEWIEFDIQWYLQGTPWAHHTVEDSEVSSVHAASAKWGGPPADTCGFDVVLKRTRTNVKYGDQIKVAFSIRSRNPAASSDKLFVGIEHWDSGIHYVKSSVTPPVNRTHKAAPDYEHNGAIFWKDVPHRPSRSFKASFFSDKKGVVEFHPGACLQNGTTKYCCKYETIRVNVVDP